jgi:hypothetical protein
MGPNLSAQERDSALRLLALQKRGTPGWEKIVLQYLLFFNISFLANYF